ncbi:MAG: ABC transporter permease, partial [Hyphomicrobiaceae bacterium]
GLVTGYAGWMYDLARGDLGTSMRSNRNIAHDLRERIAPTIEMTIVALISAILIGIPIGSLSAIRQEKAIDHVSRSIAVLLVAIPHFWLGLLCLTFGFQWFGWVPPVRYAQLWENAGVNFQLVVIPGLILGAGISASVMRLTRSAMLEVLRQDYVRTARSKGLAGSTVLMRHALRNALIPIVTILGIQVPLLMSGTVVLESIFSIPGIGTYLIAALQQRDYSVIQAVVVASALIVLVTNLVVDLSYSIIDPRVGSGS